MNEQLRFRKAIDGKGRADQVAVWDGSDTLTGSEDLTIDARGRLRNLGKPVTTEAPQDGKLYGRRDAGWAEVKAAASPSSAVAAAAVKAATARKARRANGPNGAAGASAALR